MLLKDIAFADQIIENRSGKRYAFRLQKLQHSAPPGQILSRRIIIDLQIDSALNFREL
jgi:hypothetical protein